MIALKVKEIGLRATRISLTQFCCGHEDTSNAVHQEQLIIDGMSSFRAPPINDNM